MEAEEPVADAVALAVGERIRHWRTERGLLMRQLAETADIGQPFLSKIERGEASPSMLSCTASRQRSTSLRETCCRS